MSEDQILPLPLLSQQEVLASIAAGAQELAHQQASHPKVFPIPTELTGPTATFDLEARVIALEIRVAQIEGMLDTYQGGGHSGRQVRLAETILVGMKPYEGRSL
jgi:hypothetical protein